MSSTRSGAVLQGGEQNNSECPLCGGMGFVREDLPIDHPDFGQLSPCRCKLAEIEKQRMASLRALSNLANLTHMTFDAFVPEGIGLPPDKAANLRHAFEEAQRFADDPQGWRTFIGGYGCGKTHLAAAIANQSLERGQAVLFVVVPDLLDHLRATFGPNSPISYDERFDQVRGAPLLILDDLGTQSSTPWAQEKLYQILNHRYNARLPTVITSNHSLEEIDPRLLSRLADLDLGRIVPILAPDFRRSGLGQDQSDLSTLAQMGLMSFDTFDLRQDELPAEEAENLRNAFDLCIKYAQQPEGWVVLTGEYGCGKTHLAAAIANTLVSKGQSALFISVPDLLDHLRATFSPNSRVRFDKRFNEVRDAPFLVLDDLSTESASPWAREKLYQLLNSRYNLRLPTVVTSAQSIDEIDPRIRTRMLDLERCTVFGIVAPNYRGTSPREARTQKKPRYRRGSA